MTLYTGSPHIFISASITSPIFISLHFILPLSAGICYNANKSGLLACYRVSLPCDGVAAPSGAFFIMFLRNSIFSSCACMVLIDFSGKSSLIHILNILSTILSLSFRLFIEILLVNIVTR